MKSLVVTRVNILRAALVLTLAGLGVCGAQAQIFYEDFEFGPRYAPPGLMGRRPAPPVVHDGRIPARALIAELKARGFADPSVAGRRDDVVLVDARDRRGLPVRLVVDAYEGEVLARFSRPETRTPPRTEIASLLPERMAPLPLPPKRPSDEVLTGSIAPRVAPKAIAAPSKSTRPATDWAPINSVPVAPLE